MKPWLKTIPNIITCFRIILSIILLFLVPLDWPFLVVYGCAGISDMLDGFIARQLHITSRLGATLDSIADAVMVFILLFIFIPNFQWPLWFIIWIGVIIAIRLGSFVIGFIRFRALAFLHTYANKATGLALFCFPLLLPLLGLDIIMIVLCTMASISAVEELILNAVSPALNREVISIVSLLSKKQ